MKEKYLFSIIVPIYNAEKYIKQCIDSILNQTYKSFELILINDGSTDNTKSILRSYSDKRVIIIDQKNMGVNKTRIKGVKKACGKYILFIDADDFIDKDTLQIYADELKTENFDIVKGNYKEFLNDKYILHKWFDEDVILTNRNFDDFLRDLAISSKYNSLWNEVIRKEIIDTKKLNNSITMGEDKLFNFYVWSKSKKIKIIDKFVYNYRANDEGITKSQDINKIINSCCDALNVNKIITSYVKKYSTLENKNLWYLASLTRVNHTLLKIVKIANKKVAKKSIKEMFNKQEIDYIRKNISLKSILTHRENILLFCLVKKYERLYYLILKLLSYFINV